MERSETATEVRLAEVMAALSLATDLGMAQPLEHALRTCVLSVRLGEALGLSEADLRDAYYYALLRYIGCNADTYAFAALWGDELAVRADFATVDSGQAHEVMGMVLRHLLRANQGASPLELAGVVARGLLASPRVANEGFAGHCEVAQRLGERLGFGEGIVRALGQLYERWDGRGAPRGLKGEAVSLAVRVVSLAQDAATFHRLGGADAAVDVVRRRRNTAYDPRMADMFRGQAEHLLAGLDQEPSWEAVLALEPGGRTSLSAAQLDGACEAIAAFADIKSPYTLIHSTGVARLAAEAGHRCGLPAADVAALRRAALLHDVGRVAVSAGVWGKAGPLSEREWEQVRLHPYHTERVLARSRGLAPLGALAALHHERLDGSGYHRGASAAQLSPAARILAAADAYQAMAEPRPHRSALPPDKAAEDLRREARSGRLDAEAVSAVLSAAGHRVPPVRREMVAGLTERETEVLRLVARGQSMKQIGAALVISEKTVDNHIQHIYGKIGVSTRAGATLFAMEHDLLGATAEVPAGR